MRPGSVVRDRRHKDIVGTLTRGTTTGTTGPGNGGVVSLTIRFLPSV